MPFFNKQSCVTKDKPTCKTIAFIFCIFMVLSLSAYDIEILKSILAEYVTSATPSVYSLAVGQSNLSLVENRKFYSLSDSQCIQLGNTLVYKKINASCYTLNCNNTAFDNNSQCSSIYTFESSLMSRMNQALM